MYLMIRNPGIAPIESYTLFGASLSRFSKGKHIGQFGSGAKHAIATLLRQNSNVTIYSGHTRLEFYTQPKTLKDSVDEHTFSQICVRISGKDENGKTIHKTKELDTTLEHGVYDWTEISMALREFVSNAIDHANKLDKHAEIKIVENPRVKLADDNSPDGYTTVFVPLTVDVQKFYGELSKRFLHFSSSNELGILPKKDRNVGETNTAVIYKNGVMVREVKYPKIPSLFDYNFGSELQLDECRNVDDWRVGDTVCMALANADQQTLFTMFQSFKNNEKTYEAQVLQKSRIYFSNNKQEEIAKENWKIAWKKSFGEYAVASNGIIGIADHVARKGFHPIIVSPDLYNVFAKMGIPTQVDVLTGVEKEGMMETDSTPNCEKVYAEVWLTLEQFGFTKGKNRPPLKCFSSIMDGGETCQGKYYDGTVYVRQDLMGLNLYKVIIEELGHHITGSLDGSRDLQDFAFLVAAKLIAPNVEFS